MSSVIITRDTERLLKLPDGIEIFYNDSGPVPGSEDYTTLVTLHGSGFNGEGFQPMINCAHSKNFRVINWNRRHYRGTTPYSEEELDDLKKGCKAFFDKHAAQIAWFLAHLVQVEQVPKPDPEAKTGGIVVMGWSFGNATSLTILSDPNAIEKSVYETIEPYLRSVFLYDPPFIALGIQEPDHPVYHPWHDTEHGTPEEGAKAFERWVSSYYTHPGIYLPEYKSSGLNYGKCTDHYTISGWSDEQRLAWFDGNATALTEIPAFHGEPRNTLRRQTHQVIYDEAQVSTFFPNVTLIHNVGENTVWHCMHSYQVTKKRYEEALARGEKPRKTTFIFTKGANHFMHYECPEVLLQQVADGLKA
jgi:pimeloyl-ACP methyl ester carboxylesterase